MPWGHHWERKGERTLEVTGMGGIFQPGKELPHFDCGESGSTLRFLIPIALAVAGGGIFTGPGPADGAAPGALHPPVP